MGKIKQTEKKTPQPFNFVLIGPRLNGVVVLLDGDVYGPFQEATSALGWAYTVAKDGIFSLKNLIDPSTLD